MPVKPLQRRRQIRQQNENWFSLRRFKARHIDVLRHPTAKYLEERELRYQEELEREQEED